LLGSPVAADQDPPDINSLIDHLDPSKHGEALKAKDDAIRGLKLRATLSENLHRLGMKPGLTRAALIDQGHMEKLSAAVDATDFDEQVSTVLEELAENMPEVRGSGPVPIRTSAPMRPPVARQQLSRADLELLSPDEIVQARETGLLDELLGGPQSKGRR